MIDRTERQSSEISFALQSVAAGPTAVAAATSALSLVAQVLLLKILSTDSAGRFVLIQATAQLLMMVTGLGQPTLIQRAYSSAPAGSYNWVGDLNRTIVIAAPLIAIGTMLASWMYHFVPLIGLLIFLQALLLLSILISSRMLNADQRYAWGSMLIRLPNSFLIFPALLFLIIPAIADLFNLLMLQTALTFVIFLMGFQTLRSSLQVGRAMLSLRDRLSSVLFLATQFTSQGPEYALIALAGYLLPPSRLALYQAAAVFMRPFTLLGDVSRTIFTTELIRRDKVNMKRLRISLWLIGSLFGLLMLFPGIPVFRWIYADRYQEGASILPLLALAGIFILPEVLPRSLLIGQAQYRQISRFITAQAIFALLTLIASLFLIQTFKIQGIALALAIIGLGRLLISQSISRNVGIEQPGADHQPPETLP